jgi:hypothetical protein
MIQGVINAIGDAIDMTAIHNISQIIQQYINQSSPGSAATSGSNTGATSGITAAENLQLMCLKRYKTSFTNHLVPGQHLAQLQEHRLETLRAKSHNKSTRYKLSRSPNGNQSFEHLLYLQTPAGPVGPYIPRDGSPLQTFMFNL